MEFRVRTVALIAKVFLLCHRFRNLDFDCAISGWGEPTTYVMWTALSRRKPIVAIPHGYPIMKNSNFSKEVNRILEKTGRLPDFSIRGLFDRVVVATDRNRKLLQDWNIPSEKLEVWGNARFSPNWIQTLRRILPPTQSSEIPKESTVLFLLPAPGSSFGRLDLISLIEELAKLPVTLVLKPHTRTHRIIELIPPRLTDLANVYDASNENTTRLIENAQTVITVTTGVALDALFIGRRIVYAKYLTPNSYVWEDCHGIKIANSESECLSAVADNSWETDLDASAAFLACEVFAAGHVPNPPLYYAAQLVKLAKAGRR